MIKYREYWPAFFDRGDEPIKGEVETLDELLELPFVKDKTQADNSYSLSVNARNKYQGVLLRESPDGKSWVMAVLKSDVELSPTDKIPTWLHVVPKTFVVGPSPWDGPVTPLDDLLVSGVVKPTLRYNE